MSKIIKQQLSILNKEKESDDSSTSDRVNKAHKSPLDLIRERKVNEDDTLAANLSLLRKRMAIKQKSKAAEKKRTLVNKSIQWTDEKYQKRKLTLKEKKAQKRKAGKKEAEMLRDLK